ncbi:hypothetical protein C8046_05435 [Serinibacter arcticus]|uniref:Aminoglycoside phosphotransferase domain-containing protein n=1 Tax=Serinibacter arcticus TaxID=1655435 RepID=A0A2U1ZT72_9MICO|nr:hypothetical protein [Serinibacter arcticus]PWD50187.1 hypothetical protein C8046_05435 [Serinibacter arcticus]
MTVAAGAGSATAAGSFSEVVSGEPWLAAATAWASAVLRDLGREVVGPPRQVRVRPWSTQLVLTAPPHPTAPPIDHHVWLKQGCAATSYEGEVLAIIARAVPEAVTAPLAVDPATGRFLAVDHGATLREQGRDGLADWCAVVALAARAQQQVLPHVDALTAAGLPDGSAATVAERFDALVASGARDGQDDGERTARLGRLRPAVLASGEALLASPFPVTWNHGDLHPGNVTAGGRDGVDGLRLFDLGDSDLSCALELLAVPHGLLGDGAGWDAVLGAYCDAWDVDPAVGAALWPHVERLHAVNRTHAWRRALAEATPAETARWLPDADHDLTRLTEAA